MSAGLSGTAIAAIAGGAAVLGGSILSSNAASNAADQQAQSAQQSLDFQKAQQAQNQANQQPYLDAAKTVLPTLTNDLKSGGQFNRSMTANDINANIAPDYGFTLQQGQKAINNAAASQGRYGSGAGLEALGQYNTGLAGQYANQAFSNYQTNLTGQYNRLASLAGLGQTSAGTLGGQANNQSQSIGNTYTQQGNANAAGTVGSANALSAPLKALGTYGLGQFTGNTSNSTNSYVPSSATDQYGTLSSIGGNYSSQPSLSSSQVGAFE